ncbi:M56 family metallopeptidase [Porphyromonas levii]|uniref:M56 family peptidase n=1 Tax=Porphyromonas levii TaxID=28114 RepID=A0A4Y8WMZ6_9PORP|nr:M56 family metallopeptidase [Porphyromonas levii]TFH94100.1 M56 family peptidase [Porphyromonas levii]TFH97303.1 M56 family peptidase [Porphyromonas levii]
MVLLRYLALSGLGIALFYLIDRLILRKSTLLRTQRYYYVIAIVASLFLPLLPEITPWWQSRVAEANIPTFTIILEDEFVVTAEQSQSIDWWGVAKLVWLAGILVTGGWLLVGIVSIFRIQRHADHQHLPNSVNLYLTEAELAPFTFGKSIYIPRSLNDRTIIDSILLHELEHIQQRHYIDMLLGCVLQLVQWWNPFAWSMLQQQRNTLEYLADQGVLRLGKDRKTYQYHLLACTIGRMVQLPSLSFSMQNLKQRIVMMNSNKKSHKSLAVLYAVAALPVVALLLVGTQMITVKEALATETTEVAPPPEKDGEIFEFVEDMPEFPGGIGALMKWLGENIKYPEEAEKQNIQGRVMVHFVVETDGSVSNPQIARSVHESLDAEAVRVVAAMPKWTPGKAEGKPVRVRFTLPISFALKNKVTEGEKDKVYDYVDNVPEFPGGQAAMMKWLSENIKYPDVAVKENIQGRVMLSFVIETDGSLSDVKVVKGVHEALDAEAIRVVKMMPNWKPASLKDGTLARVAFVLPVQFRFAKEKTDTPDQNESK